MLRKLTRLLLSLLLLLVAGISLLLWLSLPGTRGQQSIAGLSAAVNIHYDDLLRPYVVSATLEDALAAQGWLHARHRLWQMELVRRAGRGRLAEMLGADAVATDRELWTFGVPQLGLRLMNNASPKMTARIQSYVEGVNAGIEAYSVLPVEFLLLQHKPSPWTPEDVFAVGAMMALESANNSDQELLRAAIVDAVGSTAAGVFMQDGSDRVDYPFIIERGLKPAARSAAPASAITASLNTHQAVALLDRLDTIDSLHNPLLPRLAFGSNGWVVAPHKSETGHALYAFDSHDSLGLPNLFYEVHLFFAGTRQLRGWSVAGLPGVINGYNEAIAWGFTNIGDTQDLFFEEPCTGGDNQFRDGDDCYSGIVESIDIPVAGELSPRRFDIIRTRNGPLIHSDPPVALAWTVHHIEAQGLDALLNVNLARSWKEFNCALDAFAAPTLNATYADIYGNIGFRTAGLLPRRGTGQGLIPHSGAEPDHRWQGMVEFAHMPRLANPDSGFIAAANARVNPSGVNPLVSADNAAPYRIDRLQSVLSRQQSLGLKQMQDLQMDWHDPQAEQLLPTLLQAVVDATDVQTRSKDFDEALVLLKSWLATPVAAGNSSAALIFQHWYLDIARAVFEPRLGKDLYQRLLKENYVLNHALDSIILDPNQYPQWGWNETRTRAQLISASLEATLASLTAELGPTPLLWRLDQLQSISLRHELSRAVPALSPLLDTTTRPWGGSPASVGRAGYRYKTPFEVSHGATVRVVAEMSIPPRVAAIIPGGQSGHPMSDHYSDQLEYWLSGDLIPVHSDTDALQRHWLLTPQ